MLNGYTLFIAFFLVNEIVDLGNIGITVKQNTMRGQTIASGTPDLLIIALDALGQVMMNDKRTFGLLMPIPKATVATMICTSSRINAS
jgi:hypothetical protein